MGNGKAELGPAKAMARTGNAELCPTTMLDGEAKADLQRHYAD